MSRQFDKAQSDIEEYEKERLALTAERDKLREALVAYMNASEYCPNTSEETITKVEQLLGAVLGGGET